MIRWRCDESNPERIDWRIQALVIAPIFFNFGFLIHLSWVDLGVLPAIVVASCLIAFCYAPFGLRTSSRVEGGFATVDEALGKAGGIIFRLAAITFCLLWIVHFTSEWWLTPRDYGTAINPAGLVLPATWVLVTVAVFLSGLGSLATHAKQARFTIKLTAALAIAAVVRSDDYWPEGLAAVAANVRRYSLGGIERLLAEALPLAVLAASRIRCGVSRRDVWLSGLCGATIPLIVAILLIEFLQPAPQPKWTVAIDGALWGSDARAFIPAKQLLAAITLFGCIRFASATMVDAGRDLRVKPVYLALILAVAMAIPVGAYNVRYWAAKGLCTAAAVITADQWLSRSSRWKAWIAWACGLAVPFVFQAIPSVGSIRESHYYSWFLLSYATAFFARLALR